MNLAAQVRRTVHNLRSRTLPVVLGGSAVVLGASGCGAALQGADVAQVRFLDTSTNAPAMDLYVNGTAAAYGIGFGTVTSYLPVAAGEVNVSTHRTTTAQQMVGARAALESGRQYTVVAGNVLGNLEERFYPDATGPAPVGAVAVRVLQESPDSGPVDVYLAQSAAALGSATEIARSLGYAGASGYVDVPAGQAYVVAIVSSGGVPSPLAVVHRISVSGESGAVRTLVLTDTPGHHGKGTTGFVLDDFDTP